MTTNMTQLKAVTGAADLVQFAVDHTGGLLFGLFSLAIFFVGLLALKNWEFEKGLLTMSFLCFLLTLPLFFAKWITALFPLGYLIIFAFTALYMVTNRKT